MKQATGFHHITMMAKDGQRLVDFYQTVLGLRIVKQTVNFDDPSMHHLYVGDATGTPGTLLTFFPLPHIAPRRAGWGEVTRVWLGIGAGEMGRWRDRLRAGGVVVAEAANGLRFEDSEGTPLGLCEGAAVDRGSIGPVVGIEIEVREPSATEAFLHKVLEPTVLGQVSINRSERDRARVGSGSVHHVAFAVEDEQHLRAMLSQLLPGPASGVVDRDYFKSVYVREPGHVLVEFATNEPGFLIDEPAETLGTRLVLPTRYKGMRREIEARLPEIQVVATRAGRGA